MIPFFAFPPAVRKVIYTTNAIESINARLRKIIKTRGHFPSDDAATKLIWLALRNITADWGRAAQGLEGGDEPIRDPLRGPLHQGCRVICGTDLPTASVVRRKRRPPPWTSLRAPRTQKFRHSLPNVRQGTFVEAVPQWTDGRPVTRSVVRSLCANRAARPVCDLRTPGAPYLLSLRPQVVSPTL